MQDPFFFFYDLARGLSLTRKKDALQWDGGEEEGRGGERGDDAAAHLPPLHPTPTPLPT